MDKREQIARMAQTKEDEMLLARVYERMTNAAARSIPASTCFLSKREQMLAAELLRTTPQRVQDIAARVGYESQGRFAQAFYDQFRLTPLEYRRLSK